MTEYLTEQEQIQQLKNWLKQYGPAIITGILLALLISYGWRYWQDYRYRILSHASSNYDEMISARAQGNLQATHIQANKLLTHYAHTPYAQMAAFMLAREAVQNKNYAEAIHQLEWVMNHSSDRALHQIAVIRLARIYIEQKQPVTALSLLKKVKDEAFIGLIAEVEGDAYLALNDRDAARKSYQTALNKIPNADLSRPILQMKLENLAT